MFRTILCASPSQMQAAVKLSRTLGYMAYGIGPGLSFLSRYTGAKPIPGGIMMLDDSAYDRNPGDAAAFAQECLYICKNVGFEGVCCDFEQPVHRPIETLVRECAEKFSLAGLTVYVPMRYADCHSEVKIYIPTAMTSGSLHSRLREAVLQYGASRLALELESLSRDIPLPSQNQFGNPIPSSDLKTLLRKRGGASFYSNELCAHYFTERDAKGQTHFYVYDDALSFRRKTDLALSMGIREGFLLYPDAVRLEMQA